MSTALMEAASMGRPLIATNIAGCKELITNNETGYICEPKNVNDLVDKMECLILLSDEALAEMGHKSREKMIDEFSIQNILPIYKKAVKQIVI